LQMVHHRSTYTQVAVLLWRYDAETGTASSLLNNTASIMKGLAFCFTAVHWTTVRVNCKRMLKQQQKIVVSVASSAMLLKNSAGIRVKLCTQ